MYFISQIANVGPADYNFDESISTLRYANRAKNIKNKARINEDPKDAMLRQFQKELEELRKQLADGGEYVNHILHGMSYMNMDANTPSLTRYIRLASVNFKSLANLAIIKCI